MKRSLESEEEEAVVWKVLESSFGALERNSSLITFDDFCKSMERALKKRKAMRSEEMVSNYLLSVMEEGVLPFMELEDILNGSVFLVCRDWYDGLINNETLWNVLFERLFSSTVEFAKTFDGWPLDKLHNEQFDVQHKEKKKEKNQFWSTPIKTDHDWKFKKDYCLAKYASFKKHVKLGTVKSYLCSSYLTHIYLTIANIEPTLCSPFHIVQQRRKGKKTNDELFALSADAESEKKSKAAMGFSLDYYNIAIPNHSFTMNIDLYYDIDEYDKRCNVLINVTKLDAFKPYHSSGEDNLVLVKYGKIENSTYNEDYEEEEEEEQEEEEQNTFEGINTKAISTFCNEWLGEPEEVSNYHRLLNFVSSFRIEMLNESLLNAFENIEEGN